jgi:hypothetical protein
MRNLNLFLALLWLVFGVGLIVWHALTNDPNWRVTVGEANFSLGWAAVLLALYNLVRWWSAQSYRWQRQVLEEEWHRREQKARRAARRQPAAPVEPVSEPDPNFLFTDPPVGQREVGE